MNSKILELIEYAVKDGVITAKEREAVYKTAKGYGYTPEEVDLVMDARLFEMQQSKSYSKGSIVGQKRQCPACGALVNSGQLKCQDCGYEFSGIGPNAFVRDFQNQLEYALSKVTSEKEKAEGQFISTYPLPTTKEDSIEMLSYLLSSIQSSNKCWRKYLNYYDAILSRLKILGRGDKEVLLLIEDFENASRKVKKHKIRLIAYKIVAILVAILAVVSMIAYFEMSYVPNIEYYSDAERIVGKLIVRNKLDKARDLLLSFGAGHGVSDVYCNLIGVAIKNNRIDIAEEAADYYINSDAWNIDEVVWPYYNYLIEQGEYDKAEKYTDTYYKSDYYEYLMKCIRAMCEKQKYAEAEQFIMRKSTYFEVQDEDDKKYNRSNVIKELNVLVRTYENGAIQ